MGATWERHGMCELAFNVDCLSTAGRRPAQIQLLPVTMRTFPKFNQSAAAFGTCLFVLMTMETADGSEYELTLKLKPVILLLC
jgi:hypothetical protein